jgi:hypothetical protein
MTTAELFKVLSDKIDANHENTLRLLTNIEAQTTKTNGTVREHEKRLNGIEVGESRHVINCPRIQDIKKIEESIESVRSENELWRMAMKYPKVAVGIIIVSVLITCGVVGYSILEMHTMISDFKTEQKK